MKTEIRVIESKENMHYRVTVNGIDDIKPIPFEVGNPKGEDMIAKSLAFDIILLEQMKGNKVHLSYDSY